MIRILVFCGVYWGPPILGNYHIITQTDMVDSTATAVCRDPCPHPHDRH